MNSLYDQTILFIVMFFTALFLNPMNVLAYSTSHLYLSSTLLWTALYMASTMICSHQIVHYLQMGNKHFNLRIFFIGLCMMFFCIVILRSQIFVSPSQWIRRMIPHHSTAITTTKQLLKNNRVDEKTFRLAKDILLTQQKEIDFMKTILYS